MAESTTTSPTARRYHAHTAAPVRDVTKGVIVSDKTTLIKDAHNTARELGGQLATFMETIFDLKALRHAADGNYALAVDPKGLPKKEGWYLLERTDEAECIPIRTEGQYVPRKREGRDILHVSDDAVKAAKKGRSVELDVSYIRYEIPSISIYAYGWPHRVALVTLSRQSVPQANAVPTELLRRAQEQLGKFKETARVNATDAIEEVLRRIT